MGIVDCTNYEDMKYAIQKLDDSEFRNPFGRSYIRVKAHGGIPREKRSRSKSQSRCRSRIPKRNRRVEADRFDYQFLCNLPIFMILWMNKKFSAANPLNGLDLSRNVGRLQDLGLPLLLVCLDQGQGRPRHSRPSSDEGIHHAWTRQIQFHCWR